MYNVGICDDEEDIDKLWQHKKDPAARIVLMMIYSGFRLSRNYEESTEVAEEMIDLAAIKILLNQI